MRIGKLQNLICTGGSASGEGGSSRSDHPGFEAKTPVEGFIASGGHLIHVGKTKSNNVLVSFQDYFQPEHLDTHPTGLVSRLEGGRPDQVP